MDRLNIQAHKNAMNSTDEYVMESFVTFDKMKVLIYDLLLSEVWKQKLHPLLKQPLQTCNTVRSYMTVSKKFEPEISRRNLKAFWKIPEPACFSN